MALTTVPSAKGVPEVAVQLPFTSTKTSSGAPLASRIGVPSVNVKAMESPGLPVPVIKIPLVALMLGTLLSTVEVVGWLRLPATSVWVADSASPFSSVELGVILQVPSAATMAVPITVLVVVSVKVTVAPASPVPVIWPTPLVGSITGVATTVSIITGNIAGKLVLPAGSVAVMLNSTKPLG